jgi:hypothetical protein
MSSQPLPRRPIAVWSSRQLEDEEPARVGRVDVVGVAELAAASKMLVQVMVAASDRKPAIKKQATATIATGKPIAVKCLQLIFS